MVRFSSNLPLCEASCQRLAGQHRGSKMSDEFVDVPEWEELVKKAFKNKDFRDSLREMASCGVGYMPAAKWVDKFCISNDWAMDRLFDSAGTIYKHWPENVPEANANVEASLVVALKELRATATVFYLMGAFGGFLASIRIKDGESEEQDSL